MRIWTLTASALLLVGNNAFASDGNKALIDQDGSNNSASIAQKGLGGNIFGGNDDHHARQKGGYNSIDVIQSGSKNKAGSLGLPYSIGDRGIDQIGNANSLQLRQDGARNRVSEIQQHGYSAGDEQANVLTIEQRGRDTIGSIVQRNTAGTGSSADANRAAIEQTSNRNGILAIEQVGVQNTLTVKQDGDNGNKIGLVVQGLVTGAQLESVNGTMKLVQDGAQNQILAVGQIGANDTATVRQIGDGNTVGQAVQLGDYDTLKLAVQGNYNFANAFQQGDENAAILRIHADSDGSSDNNGVDISQIGNRNSVRIDITGDGNGDFSSSFIGAAALIGLDPGTVMQGPRYGDGGNDNQIRLTVDDALNTGLGGNGNLFAFAQVGSHNKIDGEQFGDSNQAAIKQAGNHNSTTFTQLGFGNVIGVRQ